MPFEKGHTIWKDRKHSPETKAKMSSSKKGKKFTDKHKRNLSKSLIGRKLSKEHKDRIGLKHKGKVIKDWHKEVLRKCNQGKNCNFWKGGISFEKYTVDWTEDLRRGIRRRDKYICQICDKEPAVIVRHIDYNKKNCNPNNLITLCQSCHSKTNINRNYWIRFFKEKFIDKSYE